MKKREFSIDIAPRTLPPRFRWGALITGPLGNMRWVIGPTWDALVPEGDSTKLRNAAIWLACAEHELREQLLWGAQQ